MRLLRSIQAASSSDASLQNYAKHMLIVVHLSLVSLQDLSLRRRLLLLAWVLAVTAAKAVAADAPLLLQSVADAASANIQDLSGAISDTQTLFNSSASTWATDYQSRRVAVQYYIRSYSKLLNQRK
jgi:hypothetical protein